MNRNLYLKELKRNRKNGMIWSGIVVGLTFLVLAIYPYMLEMGQGMTALMEQIPAELSKAMGMDANTWSSILGFYSTYYGIYIVVLISIYTASTGATIISKEEKGRTAEFLLTRPISRKTIFTSKLAALLTLSFLIFLVQTVVAIIGITLFAEGSVDWSVFGKMHMAGLILMLFFTTLGVIISMFVTPKKNFMGMVVGITFGSYFLNAIAKSTEATSWLGYFSPFHYMEFTIDPSHKINFIAGFIMIMIGVALLILSFIRYQKKDIAG